MNAAPASSAPACDRASLDRTLVNAFLENIPQFVYFKDRESRFIAVSRSKARRHGLEPGEMAGKCDVDYFSEQHAQWARVDEESIINTGTPMVGKLERVVWADGRESWVETTKLPLRDEHGEIVGTFGLSEDVTREQKMQADLEATKRHLVETSHTAGMAEVATGVLHNVGNVLTSLNVSASVIGATLRQSKVESLGKLTALLNAHRADLGGFVAHDPKGQRVVEFLASLARHAAEERDQLLREIASLQQNVDHIKEIVTMQQAYATMVGVAEPLDAIMLMEDAIRMNAGAFVRHDISVVREFEAARPIWAEKAKVLQILVNLIRNAKHACDEAAHADKVIALRVEPGPDDTVLLVVRDNGGGIAPENMARLFERGFTTRRDGHGFGLHSAAAAAREMQGALRAASAGPGQGATFTLQLPVAAGDPIPANSYCAIPR